MVSERLETHETPDVEIPCRARVGRNSGTQQNRFTGYYRSELLPEGPSLFRGSLMGAGFWSGSRGVPDRD